MASNSSIDKMPSSEKGLAVKATEGRSPSPIPEDPAAEEANKQSTSLESPTPESQESRIDGTDESKKGNVSEQREEKSSGKDAEGSEEQTKEETSADKNTSQQSENTQGNNGDNTGAEIAKSDGESDQEKFMKSSTVVMPESVPIQTTQLRGKSKATGQIMGGWI